MNSMKALFLAATLSLSSVALIGCSQKAEQPQTEQAQVPDSSAAFARYKQEIDGLSQIGFTVRTIDDGKNKFQIYKEDIPPFDTAVADLEKRIKADPAIEGTEASGQKADLLIALKDSAFKNAPYTKVVAMNNKTKEELSNHLQARGQEALKDSAFQQTYIALYGTDAWLKLYEKD